MQNSEIIVIAYLLENQEAVPAAQERLTEDCFTDSWLRSIYKAVVRAKEKRMPMTFHILDQIMRKKVRPREEYDAYTELAAQKGRELDEYWYAMGEVVRAHERGVMIDGVTKIGQEIAEDDIKRAREEVNDLKRRVDGMAAFETGKCVDIRTDVDASESAYEEAITDADRPMAERKRIVFGMNFIDATTGGAMPGELWLWGGAAKSGKTQTAKELSYRVCASGKNVFMATLEMSVQEIKWMMETRHSHKFTPGGLLYEKIRLGLLTKDELKIYKRTLEDWKRTKGFGKMFIWQPPYRCTVEDLRVKLEVVDAQTKIDMVVIDYIELLDDEKTRDEYRIRFTEKLRRVKAIARSFRNGEGVFILSPHQINRQGYQKGAKRGYHVMEDLAETANAERIANLIGWCMRTPELEEENKIRQGIAAYRSGSVESMRRGIDLMGDFAHSIIEEVDESTVYDGGDL